MQPSPSTFRIKRNPDYLASVRAGLRIGLWLAPTTLMQAVKPCVVGFCLAAATAAYSAFMLVARVAAWVILCLALIIMGLAGFVVSSDDNQG